MKKYLLIHAKKIIGLCFFLSGILWANGASSQSVQDSIRKTTKDSLKKEMVNTVTNLKPNTIPVLYGEQSRSQLVQAVGYLSGKKLESAPVTLLSNAFAGQLAGLYSSQTNGAPRYDNPTLSLRGRNPLIVIDGIPRPNLVNLDNNQTLYDVLSINPEQIESITLLKDALSTAMLGNRGMNGVLMVKTRNGAAESQPFISISAQAGVQTPIGMRKALSAFDYASLYNEAAVNSGYLPVYTQAQLDGYKNGTDPYGLPDVDWKNAVLKRNAINQRYNIGAGGNYKNIKYFVSLDYQWQGGLLKEPADSIEQTNVDYKRYIFRSNIELKIDQRLTANFNLLGNIQDYIQPGAGTAAVFTGLLNTPNNAVPIYNPNSTFAGSRIYPTHPYGESIATGHLQNNLQAASVDIGVKRTMDDLVKGLWIKATLSYNPSYEQQIDRSRDYNAYYYPDGLAGQALRVNAITDRLNSSSVIERFQQTYTEISTGINRNWQKSDFTALLLGSYNNSQGDNTLNQVYKNLASRLTYSFDQRYNVEIAAAYSGNNWFAPGNQYDFYPSAGASWNIQNEQFFKNVKFINELKLRASYGKVGNANPGYYVFNQNYVAGPAYFFGTSASSTNSIFQGALANPDRVAEKADKLNIGLDLAYSKDRGWINFDYYNNMQYDLLQPRGSNTAILGQVYPDENIGKSKYYGVEISTGWADKAGELNYSISGNFSTIGSRIIYNDEPAMAYPYLAQTGHPVNQVRGYVADGLFNSGNLNSATMSGFSPSAGDVKYKDLNSDGVINQYDQTIIGNSKPLIYYGANVNLQFKGFDLSALFQGVANRDILTVGNYEFPFSGSNGKGQAYGYNLDRYTPQTASTAKLPRVTLGNDINNYITSSLFVQNGNYIRLKSLELGYSFSSRLLAAIKVKKIRLFVNSQNLATFSKYKESDPEDYTGLYPLQRMINGGLSIKL